MEAKRLVSWATVQLTYVILLTAIAAIALRPRQILSVGDGKPFSRIEDALRGASAGAEIDVFPSSAGYTGTAAMIHTPRLLIKGIGKPVTIHGGDFEYSGKGNTPRAIFQIQPEADGVTIENFELIGARNATYNGAGIRINAASGCTIRNCNIHGNDMGIMSNGQEGNAHAAEHQLIERCQIHDNGNIADPGYNHNLYLGGTSVTVRFCTISHSLTGHNLKSRAHFTLIEFCEIFGSANREIDFVESWDTRRPHSNAVLVGNIITKDPDCKGNRVVINFGEESGRRDGTLYLINDTIRTPFHSAVIELSSEYAHARLDNNVIQNRSDAHPLLIAVEKGARPSNVTGNTNVLSPAYDVSSTSLNPETLTTTQSSPPTPAFYADGSGQRVPVIIGFRHTRGEGWQKVTTPSIGAGN